MKKTIIILSLFAVQVSLFAQEYFPEGTRWIEIRLDTLEHSSWYSKIDGEWVPNFETIEYYVQGEYVDKNGSIYKCVYTNGPEWTDSLTILLDERGYNKSISATAQITDDGVTYTLCPGQTYQFDWNVGQTLSFRTIEGANTTCFPPCGWYNYGLIEEIKEGDFGGVSPLKYVDLDGKAPVNPEAPWYTDTNGARIIQGIGVTEWDDGECLFGPSNPYYALMCFDPDGWYKYPWRNYRSMLVHFERNGEVLYDVWPRKGSAVEVAIDGLNYFLNLKTHEAVIIPGNNCSGEVDIPSEVSYNEETFVVKSIFVHSFYDNTELTKVRIPKTIESIGHNYPWDPDDENPPTGMIDPIYMNPFRGCSALESIEVDEENPCLKSIDGVFFSQDGVWHDYYKINSYSGAGLFCYPEGAKQESYSIPEGVEWIGGDAFYHNLHLSSLTLPNSMNYICDEAFYGCSTLRDVYCHAENVPITEGYAFEDTPIASATLHVPAGSIEEYKTTSPWSGFGNIVGLPIEINETNFPDENFRNWVLAQSYGQDGVLTEEEIMYVTTINLMGKRIQNLKGIEHFTELTTLYCTGNQLTELDVSECTKLTDLECAWNQLTTLDVSKNTALVALSCSGNQLTALDVSQNIALETLGCGLNMLTSLDVSQNTMLTELYCQENQLTELDVTKNIMLKRLGCPDNQLTSINILGHTELESLRCARNNLTQLDVSGCPALNELICMSNQIKGEAMDALVESLPTVNRGHLGVINHIDEQNVMTKSQVAAAKAKGWYVYYNNDKNQWKNYEGSDEPVIFTAGQMATIILPTEPDASKGKYYRLDRVEDKQIIFEQELQPRAHVPYIIVPNEDFSIDINKMELEGLQSDTVSIEVTFEGQAESQSICFIGSYVSEELEQQEGLNIEIIDTTPDCSFSSSGETGKGAFLIGALRAYLTWDDPIDHGGAKGRGNMEIVLRDYGTSIEEMKNEELRSFSSTKSMKNDVFDLSGRKIVNGTPRRQSRLGSKESKNLPQGIYIENGVKKVTKQ